MNKSVRIILVVILLVVLSIIALIIVKNNPDKTAKDEVKVYFSKLVGADVIVEPVTRKLIKGQDPLSTALAELIQGPGEQEKDMGFYSEIPEGSRVIDVNQKADEVRINMNKQFLSGGGSNSVVLRLKELVYTSLDAEPIRKIYLDIDGKEVETIGGEGLEVIQPLSKDNFMPEVSTKEQE